MQLSARAATLELAETFVIARSAEDAVAVVQVEIRHGDRVVVAEVLDVGPWNIDDAYWETDARRASERGRGVFRAPVNPAGIDLSDPVFAELGMPIRSVNVSRPTLDDVFMSFTGSSIRDAEEDQSKQRNRVMMQMMGGGGRR